MKVLANTGIFRFGWAGSIGWTKTKVDMRGLEDLGWAATTEAR